jgi:hypothetical protein
VGMNLEKVELGNYQVELGIQVVSE